MSAPAAPSRGTLPADLRAVSDETWGHVSRAEGFLSEREARFLMLAAVCTPASGVILEIGSFKGRSTVALGRMAKHYRLGNVLAVDPHTSPSATDPDLKGKPTSFDDFQANLRRAGVEDVVTPYRQLSRDFARSFREPIRFVFIDGDHTFDGAHADLNMFKPYLQPGAVVAMHDVLGTYEGSLRVFCDEVLASDDFGPAGFCGSIGWAQYRPADGAAARFRVRRSLLEFPARRLLPIAASGRGLVGWNKLRYKLWRPLAPHGFVDPESWCRLVAL